MSLRDGLIRALADGRLHSGNQLAAALGVSRSAVWKQVHQLAALGLEVEVTNRRGYRLNRGLELLDEGLVTGHLDPGARAACDGLEVVAIAVSTNAALATRPPPGLGRWCAMLAEYQTSGRGRLGRRWLSPFGSGLCLSMSVSIASPSRDLPALSLAAAVGVLRVLQRAGAAGLALKWPNDILVNGAKLAGVLVDVDGNSRGPLRAIIGVGINLAVPPDLAHAVSSEGGRRPGGLEQAVPGNAVGRNALAGQLLGSLYHTVEDFGRSGFAPLADEWRRHDYLFGCPLSVRRGSEDVSGVGDGVAADGALLVRQPDGVVAVFNGEVTVRAGA
jgi:BirA family biotin operon repressor/biotin-[acetyl-CoA-carboxylase] ligase